MKIPFNNLFLSGQEVRYFEQSLKNMSISGDGIFTKKSELYLEKLLKTNRCLLTTSCTSALEMSAILAGINPGDEIIMPSFTFVSTANAFILRGGIPIFADINPKTLCLDEQRLEALINNKTKCIVPVHYAGSSSDMEYLLSLSKENNLIVIEDAAQAINSTYKNKSLGTLGDLGTFSFHQTKNITCGEGGALIINNREFIERAEIIREKGTDRKKFCSGQIDKYTWVDIGSSFVPSEMQASFLYAQLLASKKILLGRKKIWEKYHKSFKELEDKGKLIRHFIPPYNNNNAHMYYILLNNSVQRDLFIKKMSNKGIECTFHYLPLHLSKYGDKFSKNNSLSITENIAERIVRLPLWLGDGLNQDYIIETSIEIIQSF